MSQRAAEDLRGFQKPRRSDNPLTIALLAPAHPYRGGLAAFTERLAHALQDRGHRVIIYTFTLQYPDFLFPGKTQYTDAPPPEGLLIHRRLNAVGPGSWWRLGRELRRLAPDLIVPAFWLPFMAPALGSVLRLARRPATHVRALVHNLIPHEKRPGDRFLSRYFVGVVDSFVTLSAAVADDLRDLAPGKPVAVTPHPVYDSYGDPVSPKEARRELQLEENGRYLLFFGFIREYKGLDLLLQAMADPRLAALDVRLVVAGEYYGNQAMYEKLIAELGIADRLVLHTDFIPDNRVRYYFSAADLVVQSYRTATQSGISQLAYHFEKPMVVTRVGGLPEIVPHGEAGYVVDPEPAAIAAAVVDFFDQDRAATLSEGVRRRKHLFSWETLAEVMVNGMGNSPDGGIRLDQD